MLQSKLKLPAGARGKNLDAYLDRVYAANKKIIDSLDEEGLFGTRLVGKTLFKEEIKAKLDQKGWDMDKVGDAIKELGRTELFYSRAERSLENAKNAIKQDEEVFKRFRKMYGWNRKINWDDLKQTEDPNEYIIGNILISFKRSPQEIIFKILY